MLDPFCHFTNYLTWHPFWIWKKVLGWKSSPLELKNFEASANLSMSHKLLAGFVVLLMLVTAPGKSCSSATASAQVEKYFAIRSSAFLLKFVAHTCLARSLARATQRARVLHVCEPNSCADTHGVPRSLWFWTRRKKSPANSKHAISFSFTLDPMAFKAGGSSPNSSPGESALAWNYLRSRKCVCEQVIDKRRRKKQR